MARETNKEFSFVMGTCPADFKKRETLTSVRKAVMNDYLTRARDDPNSKDRRAQGRRKTIRQRRQQRLDHQTQDERRRIEKIVAGEPGGSPISSGTVDSHDTQSSKAKAPVRPETVQYELVELSDRLNSSTQAPAISFSEQSNSDPALVPGRKMLERLAAFSVAYHRKKTYGHPEKFVNTDRYDKLPVSLDFDLLRINCVTYFGSQASFEEWIPFTLSAPHVFLASLSVSAPYTDLIDLPANRQGLSPFTDTRHTLELLDILPRIINDRLHDPVEANSDSNIVAVVCFMVGQLSTPYAALIPAHQRILKSMVDTRGGLDALSGNGVIAMNLTLANLEASVLRHETPDQMYMDWIDRYILDNQAYKYPAPDGILYCSSQGMQDLGSSRLCKSETLHLILLMHDLTEKVYQLHRDSRRQDEKFPSYTSKGFALDEDIRQIVERTHLMRPIQQDSTEAADWIYESVRLSALLFCHAVTARAPLGSHLPCSLSMTCKLTPIMIHDTVKRTPIKDIWDHLAGVLYWVLMIAAIACHDEEPDEEEPVGWAQSQSSYDHVEPDFDDTSEPQADYGALAQAKRTYNRIVLSPTPPHETGSGTEDVQDELVESWAMLESPPAAYLRADRNYNIAKRLYNTYNSCLDDSGGRLNRKVVNDNQTMACWYDVQKVYNAWDKSSPDNQPRVELIPSIRIDKPPSAQQLRRQSLTPQEKQRAMAAYVKRYLTANAIRVSILLRFEHKSSFLRSVRNLVSVNRWLNKT
ncbi:Hypothetical protein D9617_1g085400 [Elsinoe fawcettii]|nr:Hypothetical protein D9617_1g085400 [Elsinoe fawcettii]